VTASGTTDLARGCSRLGFTLVELMIVLAIIATMTAMVMPRYRLAVQTSRRMVAIAEIKDLGAKIELFEAAYGMYPASLADLGEGPQIDPWGNAYRYLDFSTVEGKGTLRKDKFLVPLNSNFDLYSMGPDGQSLPPLTAKASRDDVVRANDGDFVGVAEDY
jgi:general secretion pathway protein G